MFIPTLFNANKEILDRLIKGYKDEHQFEKIRLFIDISGAFFSIHSDEKAKIDMINDHNKGIFSYATSMIRLTNHWIGWFNSHMIDYEIYLFVETGDSVYHENIDETYKQDRKKRHATSLPTKFLRDAFSDTKDYNIKMLRNVLNTRGSRIKVVYLDGLEGDFLPSYIIQKHHDRDSTDEFKTLNVTLSKDKDLCQSLSTNHIQLTKNPKQDYKIYTQATAYSSIMKNKKIDSRNYPIKFFSLALGIIGDSSDSIKGVKMLGDMGVSKFIENNLEVLADIGTPDEFFELVESETFIQDKFTQKVLAHKTILTNAYKLINFEELVAENSGRLLLEVELLVGDYAPDPDFASKKMWYDGQLGNIVGGRRDFYYNILNALR